MSEIITQVKELYIQLSRDNVSRINEIYTQDIVFKDPVNEVHGLDQLTTHFAQTYSNVTKATFEFNHEDEVILNNMAYLNWQMIYAHPKLNSGRDIVVDGVTLVRFDEKVWYHRDWFDMGAMIYQYVPVLGGIVKVLNRRLTA